LWLHVLSWTVTIIYYTFYFEGATPIYKKKSRARKKIDKMWQAIIQMATYVGDYIEANTRSSRRKRSASILSTYRRHRIKSTAVLAIMTVMAMDVRTAVASERITKFDTDSDTIGVDNRCSGCISHVKEDFVGPLRKSNKVVKGFAGTRVTKVKTGTLRWSWEDDQGRKHTFDIPNSYYIPDGKVRLLSPQHWAQSQNGKNHKRRDHCGERTNGSECVLYWNGGDNKRHIPLGRNDNVATFEMAHGYRQFAAFCYEADIDVHCHEITAMPSGIISDDDDSDRDIPEPTESPPPERHWTPPTTLRTPSTTLESTPMTTEFNLNGPSMTASEGERSATTTPNVIIDEENENVN
jgi:bacterioferritin-associated ferredoxin